MKNTITVIAVVVFMQVAALVIGDMLDLQPAERATGAPGRPQCAKAMHLEAWYRDKLAEAVRGATEVTCYLGRVDVMTATHAYEVDKLEKHHECLGQAMWYGWATHKRPTMALIVPFGSWRRFRAIKEFVESNSAVRVVAIEETTGALMAEYETTTTAPAGKETE